MADTLGTIRGQMILDVKQALAAYTQARQAHISTVTALHTGAGAAIASGTAIAGVGAAMVAGFGVAVGAAAEFERRLDYFLAVSGATQAEYDAISKKALQLGADTIYSANQIADSFIELGKSGVKAEDIINGIGEGVAALGAAADIPLDTAANIITAAVATFQLGAENAVMVADKLAGAANASIIDVQDLGVSLKYVGGVASSLGVPFEDVNTALGILGENGIKGSTAGTSLRQVLLGLNGATGKAKDALKELGIITEDGSNKFYDAEGRAKSLAEVFQILQDATAGMSDQQRTATFQQIFAVRSLPSLIALTREGADGFRDMADAINSTTALEVASQRLDNLSGDLEILRGNIETLLITAGGGFQNIARFIVQSVTNVIQVFLGLPSWAQTAVTGTVAAFGGLLVVVGFLGIMAGSILNLIALGIQLAPVMTTLAGAFRTLAGGIAAMSAVAAANPLGIILVVIGLIVGALITLYTTSETFRSAVQPIFDTLAGIFQQLQPVLMTVVNALVSFFNTMAQGASGGLTTVLTFLGQLASTIMGALGSALNAILPPLMAFVGVLLNALMPVLQAVLPIITTLGQIFAAVFSGNIAAVAPLITQLAENFLNLVTVIATTLIPTIMQLGTQFLVAIIGMLPTIITAGIQLFTGLIQAIAQVLPLVVGAIVQLITGLITTIIGMLPQLIEGALTLLTGILDALVTLLPMLIQAGIQVFTGLITALVSIIPQLITAIVNLLPVIITAIVTLIPTLITAAIQLFSSLIQGLITALPLIITALIQGVIQIVMALIEAIPLLIEAAIQLFLGLLIGLLTALPQIIIALVEAIPQIVTALTDAIPLLIEGAIQLFLGIIIGLISALPQIIDALIKAIPQIVQALIDAGPKFVEAGRQLIQGLIDGIGQMGSALWDAAQNIASKAVDAIKGFFGIASPSKLFHTFGMYLIQGLIGGIDSMNRGLIKTVSGVAKTVSNIGSSMSLGFSAASAKQMTQIMNQLQAAKAMQAQFAGAPISATDRQTAALSNMQSSIAGVGTSQTTIIEKLEVNNPSSEPTSDSLPRSIRKAQAAGVG